MPEPEPTESVSPEASLPASIRILDPGTCLDQRFEICPAARRGQRNRPLRPGDAPAGYPTGRLYLGDIPLRVSVVPRSPRQNTF